MGIRYVAIISLFAAGCSGPAASAPGEDQAPASHEDIEAPEGADDAGVGVGQPPDARADAASAEDARADILNVTDATADSSSHDAPADARLPEASLDATADAPSVDAASLKDAGADSGGSGLFTQTDVVISEVALLQGVKIPLMKDGASARNLYAPIVSNRPGLLRVYVKPGPAYKQRQLTAELSVTNAATTFRRSAALTLTKSSTDTLLTSSFNFTLTAEDLPPGIWRFSVRIVSPSPPPSPADPPSQYPLSGDVALDAVVTDKLKIVLVPVRYDFDGSKRVPDTSANVVEYYRKAFFETYPVSAVDVSVRAPMPWNYRIGPETGWDEVLDQMIALRAQDKAPTDAYYIGLLAPAATYAAFCPDSCTTGLAPLITHAKDSASRATVAISFTGDEYDRQSSLDTAIHEVGHLHGRSHVGNSGTDPYCGTPAGVDTAFPHSGGFIGAWGYGVMSKQLYSPETYSDFMGYCYENWVSDYTFGALLTRVQAITPLTKSVALPGGDYRFVHVGRDGALKWGRTVNFPSAPANAPTTIRAIDSQGANREVTGYYYPYGENEGGFLLVRTAEVAGKRIEVDLRGASRSLLWSAIGQ